LKKTRSSLEIGGAILAANGKIQKNKNKPKLNLTVGEEQRNKLEQMAALEKRSVSNLIEVMADERRERLVEQQGIAYAKTVAQAMNLKLEMGNPADREKLRRAVLELVAGRKMPSQKAMVEILSFSFWEAAVARYARLRRWD
jgi:uncharacterized protein (DUF1778 family)